MIQGFQQFGVRTGVKRGGYGGTELDNVYMEEGRGCGIDKTGAAGVIADGGTLTIRSDRNPQGQSPQFQNLGSTHHHYFVVDESSHLRRLHAAGRRLGKNRWHYPRRGHLAGDSRNQERRALQTAARGLE